MNILWTNTVAQDQLPTQAARIAAELNSFPKFCLWLIGPLGAGKTTTVGQILRQLGLEPAIPVTSPTYTYMNEYEVSGEWFAHLDLYRTKGLVSPEDLGLADARAFRGVFVEWPDKSPDDPYLQPTHRLTIAFAAGDQARTFSLSREVP